MPSRAVIVAAGDLAALPDEVQTVANELSEAGWQVRPVPPAVSGSVTCHVVTAAGREDDRTMQFFVGEE